MKYRAFIIKQFCSSQQKINIHPDVLSLGEIQGAIQKTIKTPEVDFIDQAKSGFINYKLWKKIKANYIHQNDAVKIITAIAQKEHPTTHPSDKALANQSESERRNAILKDDIFNYFLSYFSKRYERLTFHQIAVVLENYAYANRFNQEFFRLMENEIYERLDNPQEVVSFKDVESIVWAYQFCQYGSATLYDRIAKVIKIAQHEIKPLKLAYFAYLYSKSPENMKGGFGLNALAEKSLAPRLSDFNFTELVRLSKYIFTPNICSNKFQAQLEEKLSEAFPSIDSLQPSSLVKLCKATSKHTFKFNDKALYHKLESASIKLLSQISDKQFCEIVWSFIRGRRGNQQLYQLFVEQLRERQKLLSLRQLTILFLNSSQHVEVFEISKLLSEIIHSKLQHANQELKPQYVAYHIISSLKSQIDCKFILSINEIKILSVETQLLLLHQLGTNHNQPLYIQLAVDVINSLNEQSLDDYQALQLSYYSLIFRRFLKRQAEPITLIPNILKKYFHFALILDPKNESLHQALILLYQTHKEEMRFCFSQDQWVSISWVLLGQHLLDPERAIPSEILSQACLGIKEIDINTTADIGRYVQSLWMVVIIEKLSKDFAFKKLRQLPKTKLDSYIKSAALMNNFQDYQLNTIGNILLESIISQVENIVEESQMIVNLLEPKSLLLLPIIVQLKAADELLNFSLMPIFNNEVIKSNGNGEPEASRDKSGFERFVYYDSKFLVPLKYQITKFILEDLFEWKLEFINFEEALRVANEEKQPLIGLFKTIFEIQIKDKANKAPGRRRPSLKTKFSSKLQEKSSDQVLKYAENHDIEMKNQDF